MMRTTDLLYGSAIVSRDEGINVLMIYLWRIKTTVSESESKYNVNAYGLHKYVTVRK